MKPELKNLELSLILGRASVIYADENFTVYVTVKNISREPLYIWRSGILATTDFNFKLAYTLEAALPTKTIIEKFEGFVFYLLSFRLSFKKAYADYRKLKKQLEEEQLEKEQSEYTIDDINEKLTKDYLRTYYTEEVSKGKEPWELLPGESITDIFIGKPQESLFFRPDKYKLNLYVDYSNKNKEFFRETKTEEVDILTSIKSLIIGAIIGGLLGGILVRILATQDFSVIARILAVQATTQDVSLIWRNMFGIIGAVIMSMLTVIALSRRSSAQTLITIQDFWGGFFLGFLVSYSGKFFFERLMGIT